LFWLAASTSQAEQEQENVEEIEVQTQRAVDAHLGSHRAVALDRWIGSHAFDGLRIVGGQGREDDDPDDANEKIERTIVHWG
jgi:hypothetical protein